MDAPGSRDVKHTWAPAWLWIELPSAPGGSGWTALVDPQVIDAHSYAGPPPHRRAREATDGIAAWQRCAVRSSVHIDSCPSVVRQLLKLQLGLSRLLPQAVRWRCAKIAAATRQNKQGAAKNRGYGCDATTAAVAPHESSCAWRYDRPNSKRQAVIYFRDNGV
jgi:hypothetical protein